MPRTSPSHDCAELGGWATALRRCCLITAVFAVAGCGPAAGVPAADDPPAFMVGEFVDDYGIRYSIQPDLWTHHPNGRYHIVAWDADGQFAVAQNDADNPGDGGLWTRIDWVRLEGSDGSDGYDWAYCYSTYDAATRAEAAAFGPFRGTPRTGCNGFPFSRMKRDPPESPLLPEAS